MKILIAPDSFKGSLPAPEVARAIERGIRAALPGAETVCLPLADGGEGTVEALIASTGGRLVPVEATGPLGESVPAFFGILGGQETAVLEMASASGLPLVPPEKRNPCVTTTYGTGQLIRAAIQSGCRRLLIGIGGSATNDGGAGAMAALGARFLDANGSELPPGGAALARLERIDMSGFSFPREIEVVVASDVSNPLCGPTGASVVYGPQKGATPEMIEQLDGALRRYADAVEDQLGQDIAERPGAGAAGGLGAGLMAFLNARLRSGIEIVLDAVQFDRHLQGASLIITGEGRIDAQTAYGKTIAGALKRGQAAHVPVAALAGSIEPGAQSLEAMGLCAMMSIVPGPMPLEEAMQKTASLLETSARRLGYIATLLRGG
ncbi:MAG: glycerate kinase [Armatimonadetes bacterium]|nr:glycerate kinase [Armatimonadota bacterium]